MDVEAAATAAYDSLTRSDLGTVVAFWESGEVSVHDQLAFRRRSLPAGVHDEPLVTFVRFTSGVSRRAISERIAAALEKQAESN